MTDILRFKQQNTVLRPKASAVWEAAEQWINAQSSEETHFQEYVTAAEEDDAEENQKEFGRQPAFGGADPTEQADIIQQMQARLLELESKTLTAQSKAPPAAPSRNLFSQPPPQNLDTATWARLQAAAGQPPPRLSWDPSGTTQSAHCSGQLLGGRGGGRSHRQGRVCHPSSFHDRPHAEVDGPAVEAEPGSLGTHHAKVSGFDHFSTIRAGQRRRQLQHRRARLLSSARPASSRWTIIPWWLVVCFRMQ